MASPSFLCHYVLNKGTIYRSSVFSITFIGYALLHANRKTFSNVKSVLQEEWTPSFHNKTVQELHPHKTWNSRHLFSDEDAAEKFLGILDTIFMVSYAMGLYISGIIGDRFNLRYILTIGLCSSAVCVFLFGSVSEWLHVYSIPFYVILWICNGLLQSTGWPAMVAVMGEWYGKNSRGFVLGLWSSCASVGNIIGSLIVSAVINCGYEYAFMVPACMLFSWGIVLFFGLVTHPNHVGLSGPDEPDGYTLLSSSIQQDASAPLLGDESLESESGIVPSPDQLTQANFNAVVEKPLSLIEVLRLPGVILYSLSYACLKFVNYAFFFWLPFYLTKKFGWTQQDADQISVWYDVGGIAGGIIGGIVSDRMNSRASTVEFMLLLAAPSLYFYNLSPGTKVANSLLMANLGFWIGGPASLISSAISADIGRHESIRGNARAVSSVTGIVDGTGSVGAAIGQFLIPYIHESMGWDFVFYLFIVMMVLTFVCILPVLIGEVRQMRCYRRNCRRGVVDEDDYNS